MALTMRRWIIIALAGFAILPVILLNDREPRDRERSGIRERLAVTAARARGRQVRLAQSLHLARLHDSVRASLPRSGPGRTIVDPRIPVLTMQRATTLLADAQHLRSTQPRGAVDVVVVLDTATTFRGHPLARNNNQLAGVDYFAPTDSAGRCLVLVRANPRAFWGNFVTGTDLRDRFMGPCAFYEAYGPPGPGIRRWLDRRSWTLAQYGPGTSGGWYWSSRDSRRNMRGAIGAIGFRCLLGNDSACVTAMMEPGPHERRMHGPSGALMPPMHERVVHIPWFLPDRSGLGPRQSSLLGDMARSLGDEKFLAFWRSSLEPMDAFREATGRDVPSWVREWMKGHYPPQETGPTTTRTAVAFALMILAAGIGLALLAADRRQVA